MAQEGQEDADKGFHTYSTGSHPISGITPSTLKEISEMPGAEVIVDADKKTVRVEVSTVDAKKKSAGK